MTDDLKFKRIERLLKDIEYELASGLHQNQIDEQIHAEFIIGAVSKEFSAWMMKFSFKPMSNYDLMVLPPEKRFEGLTLVKG